MYIYCNSWDNILPQISCPGNNTVNNTPGICGATYYTAPVGTDNCPGATTVRTSGLASGATFPIGPTTVKYKSNRWSWIGGNMQFYNNCSG